MLLFIGIFIIILAINFLFCDDCHLISTSIISIIIFMILGSSISNKLINTEEYIVSEVELSALKDSNGIEGNVFLFSGYIEDELKIKYVVNTEYGKQVKEMKISSLEKIYIQEEDTLIPRMITYGERMTNNTWYKSLICCNWYRECEQKRIVFIVPKDTVINEYAVDLE